MTTANDILKVARAEIGYKESPANSNRTKYNRWYYGSDIPAAWCAIWVCWVFWKCNAISLLPGGKKDAYVPTIADKIIASGRSVGKANGKPGDIVTFDWNSDRSSDHVGIIEKKNRDGSYMTLEGNTAVGNDSNGGEVMRRTRYQSQISYIFRPAYNGTSTKPSTSGTSSGTLYKAGQSYVITVASGVKVRTGAGTGYSWKKRSQLTADGKKNAAAGTYAVLKKGTDVTCQEVKKSGNYVWMRIPSGWICAEEDGVPYVKKAGTPSTSGTSSSATYKVGRNYTVVVTSGVKVRVGAGISYKWKKKSQLTADGKKHAAAGAMAVLVKGTEVTCQKVKKSGGYTWLKIPSGWICAVEGKSVYVK